MDERLACLACCCRAGFTNLRVVTSYTAGDDRPDCRSSLPCRAHSQANISVDSATAEPYNMPLFEYLETPSFTRMLVEYLDDEEYVQLQRTLNDRPAAGVVVPGSGGVRKLRWGLSGRGKRGGLRVLYYVVHANVPAHVLNELRKEFENA